MKGESKEKKIRKVRVLWREKRGRKIEREKLSRQALKMYLKRQAAAAVAIRVHCFLLNEGKSEMMWSGTAESLRILTATLLLVLVCGFIWLSSQQSLFFVSTYGKN